MSATSHPRPRRRRPLTAIAASGLLAVTAVTVAVAASNSIHVQVGKKQLAFTGTAAAAGDSVQVNFDPNKCAASYTQESKRTDVAFTDFQVTAAGHFKFTVKLPIPPPSGDKPGRYACAYLLAIKGDNVAPVASASAGY